jgi:hypothetical protein
MTNDPIRYVGFAVVSNGREYQFRVAGPTVPGGNSSEGERFFTMSIASSEFRPGRLRFQEGPDVAIRNLRIMLAAEAGGNPLGPRLFLSQSTVDDYTAAGPAKNKTWSEEQRNAARLRVRNKASL